MSHIECRKLSLTYRDSGTKKGFRMEGLDLDIPDGKILCVLGPSGCGKSTLLKIIAGLQAQDSGQIIFDGMDMSLAPPAERGIGMVFQDYALFPHMTIRDNITYGLRIKKLPPDIGDFGRKVIFKLLLPFQGEPFTRLAGLSIGSAPWKTGIKEIRLSVDMADKIFFTQTGGF